MIQTGLDAFSLKNPTLYREKCSLQGHSLPFVLLLKKIDTGYPLEPRLIEYPQSVLGEKVRKITIFHPKNSDFRIM